MFIQFVNQLIKFIKFLILMLIYFLQLLTYLYFKFYAIDEFSVEIKINRMFFISDFED